MWVMLNNAFLSIVSPSARSPTLDVRARARGDIERVFPGAKVICLPNRDYAFRAHLPRNDVAAAIEREVAGIRYPNFKGSTVQNDRHDAYVRCWQAMADFQESRGHGRPYQTTATGKGRKQPKGRKGGYGSLQSGLYDMFDDLPFPPLPGDTMADLDEAEAKWLADREDTMDFDGPAHRKG
jgi:hypothetical protein